METNVNIIQFLQTKGFVASREKQDLFHVLTKENARYAVEIKVISPGTGMIRLSVIDKKEESLFYLQHPMKGFKQDPEKWLEKFIKEFPPTMATQIKEFIENK